MFSIYVYGGGTSVLPRIREIMSALRVRLHHASSDEDMDLNYVVTETKDGYDAMLMTTGLCLKGCKKLFELTLPSELPPENVPLTTEDDESNITGELPFIRSTRGVHRYRCGEREYMVRDFDGVPELGFRRGRLLDNLACEPEQLRENPLHALVADFNGVAPGIFYLCEDEQEKVHRMSIVCEIGQSAMRAQCSLQAFANGMFCLCKQLIHQNIAVWDLQLDDLCCERCDDDTSWACRVSNPMKLQALVPRPGNPSKCSDVSKWALSGHYYDWLPMRALQTYYACVVAIVRYWMHHFLDNKYILRHFDGHLASHNENDRDDTQLEETGHFYLHTLLWKDLKQHHEYEMPDFLKQVVKSLDLGTLPRGKEILQMYTHSDGSYELNGSFYMDDVTRLVREMMRKAFQT